MNPQQEKMKKLEKVIKLIEKGEVKKDEVENFLVGVYGLSRRSVQEYLLVLKARKVL